MINGVILVSWRQAVLQKQIDYGARLGHVVLSLAKMELENFFKNVMPVADYYDQSDMLIAVSHWICDNIQLYRPNQMLCFILIRSMANVRPMKCTKIFEQQCWRFSELMIIKRRC